jgi:rubrerythrin
MSIPLLFDLGAEFELKLSACYAKLEFSVEADSDAAILRQIAQDELNHSSVLRSGKAYALRLPDLFGKELIQVADIKAGIGLLEALLLDLDKGENPISGLRRLLALEKRFEQVHLDTAVEIKDASLQKLFRDLSGQDQRHIQLLTEMIARS